MSPVIYDVRADCEVIKKYLRALIKEFNHTWEGHNHLVLMKKGVFVGEVALNNTLMRISGEEVITFTKQHGGLI